MRSDYLFLLLILLLGACAGDATPEVSVPPATFTPTDVSETIPKTTTPIAMITSSSIPCPTSEAAVSTATATPTEASTPVPTTTAVPVFATLPVTLTGSILVAYGENDMLTLAQVDGRGNIWPLSERRRMSASCWSPPHLSPNGTWVAYYAPEGQDALMLYNLQTHEEQTILEPVFHAAVPIFDAASQHIAYAAITHSQDGITYQWTIHVRDITTDVETIFEGPIVGQGQDRYAEPLPGRPIAWVGNELFLDGFVPYAETVYWGIRVLDLSNISPGETISLRDYDRLVLSPRDVYYMYPTISPVGDMMAFVVYNDDHLLTCYDNFPENGAVTGLGVIPIAGGAPRILVDATGDDSALVGQPLAWSLDGHEILFAQGSCQDEPSSLEPTLRTVNMQGVITREWPLARIEYTICQEALWCAPEQIFYSRRYLREQDQLWRLNVKTDQTEQVLSSEQIRLIGCFP